MAPIIKSKSSSPKKRAQKLLKELPDDSSFEDIQYHLYVLQKVEKGLKDIEEGSVFSHEEAKRILYKYITIC
ncbi:MAG: hypothetical protein EHM58_07610 [Ignavibacteriae bacterium]|nr:MAG: hypothetical protein EHM58_07610 [Ignavibacteriota bacterium]